MGRLLELLGGFLLLLDVTVLHADCVVLRNTASIAENENPSFKYDCNALPVVWKTYSLTYIFTACSLYHGRAGPTNRQCERHYSKDRGARHVTMSIDNGTWPGVQRWTVPDSDVYWIDLCGAHGGVGALLRYYIMSMTTKEILNSPLQYTLPTCLSVRTRLQRGDVLNIAVGQRGTPACPKNFLPPGCRLNNSTESQQNKGVGGGGGGGGGGGTWITLDRGGNRTLLAVAGGGGGTGRLPWKIGEELRMNEKTMEQWSAMYDTVTSDIRPGIGGSLSEDLREPRKRQDGGPLWANHMKDSLLGGRACPEYNTAFQPHGGFGGGGGGCTAGGGGGGYNGGQVSLSDDPLHTGLPGDSFYDGDLAELRDVKYHSMNFLYQMDGSVNLQRDPPPCPGCYGFCKWSNSSYLNFTCTASWYCNPPIDSGVLSVTLTTNENRMTLLAITAAALIIMQ